MQSRWQQLFELELRGLDAVRDVIARRASVVVVLIRISLIRPDLTCAVRSRQLRTG